MKRIRVTPVVAAMLLVGCARLRPGPPPETDHDPTRLVAEADDLARNNSPRAARQVYRQVLRDHPGTPAPENALYGLGRLYVDPDSKLRDYSAADAAFARLLAEYPDGAHADDARAWHAALNELLRAQAELRRVRGDLDRLKELDMEEGQP
jgi:outer membrane protein assembly factor BamD (BamD/ComL family)